MPKMLVFAALTALSLAATVRGAGGTEPQQDAGARPYSLLAYSPSRPGNILFAILYAAAAAGLYAHVIRRRDWWGLCLPIGASFQALGFVLRMVLRESPASLPLYIVQEMCIVLSPATYFAFSYLVFGRLAHQLQNDPTVPKRRDSITLLPPRLFGRIFIISDVLTFLIQAGGGGMQTSAALNKTGAKIFLIGIIIQGLSNIIFLGLAIYTHILITPRPTSGTSPSLLSSPSPTHPNRATQTLFQVLYLASLFIVLRSVYRTVELAQGYQGHLFTHEVFFSSLDALPLLLCILTWLVVWPSRLVPLRDLVPQASDYRRQEEHSFVDKA